MNKTNGGQAKYVPTEFMFYAPKEKQSLGQFFYNSKDGTYCGRTPKSWGQLWLFYAIFYVVLAALFTICMQGLFSTLKENEPRWKLEQSLIGTNPGLGFRPMSNDTDRGSLIEFDTKKNGEIQYWIDQLDEFIDSYNKSQNLGKVCEFNHTYDTKDICTVDIDLFDECSPSNDYGYNTSSPCVFLKLNKIYGWVPDYYNDPTQLPDDMPAELKKHIMKTAPAKRQQVWVSCGGTAGEDKEIFPLVVNYFPTQGFPSYYYPYLNQDNYLSPLIAVQFPQLTPHKLINIECRAWAKNIIYSGSARDRKGSVTFQFMID